MKLSKLFVELGRCKRDNQIADFWVSLTSLDDIFVKLTQTIEPPSVLDNLVLEEMPSMVIHTTITL